MQRHLIRSFTCLTLLALAPGLVSCTSTSGNSRSSGSGIETTTLPNERYAPPGEHNADDFTDEGIPDLTIDPNSAVGKRVGQFQEVPAESLPNYRVLVVQNHKFGYMDLQGNMAIPCQFDDAKNFKEGLGLVKKGNKWGYIDHTGKFVLAPKYDKAESFKDGQAEVTTGDQYGYINAQGEWVYGPLTVKKFLTGGAPEEPAEASPNDDRLQPPPGK